jgi:GMP synthase-like glutamine amidotransferase
MHRDVAFTIPPGFQNLGTSPRCDVQGLYLPGRALSVQAHPEFDDFIMNLVLKKRHGDGIFSDDMYEDGDLRKKLDHDGKVVAEVILKLLFGISG